MQRARLPLLVGDKERFQPWRLGIPEQFHLDPAICTADNGADGADDDVQQRMSFRPVDPRIFQAAKMVANRSGRLVVHGYPPVARRIPLCDRSVYDYKLYGIY
jgi:hypothetical protein